MWKHIMRVGFVMGVAGTAIAWLSTHSIPKTIEDADGFIGTNLKWLGIDDPPKALGTTAADHVGLLIGVALLIFAAAVLLLWVIEKVFGASTAQKIISAPSVAVRYIERHIHHKELLAQTAPISSTGQQLITAAHCIEQSKGAIAESE